MFSLYFGSYYIFYYSFYIFVCIRKRYKANEIYRDFKFIIGEWGSPPPTRLSREELCVQRSITEER